MQKAERELLDEKFKGVIAMMQSNNDINQIHHSEIIEQQKKILDQVMLTNRRVANLESETKIVRFFSKKPIFFALILLGLLFLISNFNIIDLIKLL